MHPPSQHQRRPNQHGNEDGESGAAATPRQSSSNRQRSVTEGDAWHARRRGGENSGGRGRQPRRGRARLNTLPSAPPVDISSLLDPSGCYRIDEQGRYYLILEDSGAIEGYRISDIRREVREKAEESKQHDISLPSMQSHTNILQMLQSRGMGKVRSCTQEKRVAEMQLRSAPMNPSQVLKVPVSNCVLDCEFLDVSRDGETLTGCWAVGSSQNGQRTLSTAVCLSPSLKMGKEGRSSLQLDPTGSPVVFRASALVDMVVAPTDRDVTCLLYATANSKFFNGAMKSYCTVQTTPISNTCGAFDVTASPIYNKYVRVNDELYTCAWNSASMRIAFGRSECAELIDIVSDHRFRVSSKRSRVLAQAFNQSGVLLTMGLSKSDALLADLRMKSRHIVASFPDSKSTCWIRPLLHTPHHVLLSTYDGQLSLYDVRVPTKRLFSYDGHCNTHKRLPCFVDHNDNFVFAVGIDCVTRVWSLSGGGSPFLSIPSSPLRSHGFPHPVYSNCWGGKTGESALLIAAGPNINVHRLSLD